MPDDGVHSPGAPPDIEAQARREFLKKLAVAGATVPAVALLLSARASAQECLGSDCPPAQTQYGGGCGCGCTV